MQLIGMGGEREIDWTHRQIKLNQITRIPFVVPKMYIYLNKAL